MTIPIVETYRGVGIQAFQPFLRIAGKVKPAIDAVTRLSDIDVLVSYAADVSRPPEARMLAAAKVEGHFLLAVDERRARPDIDLDKVRASVVGLGKMKWISATHYCSLLDTWPPGAPGAEVREEALDGALCRP